MIYLGQHPVYDIQHSPHPYSGTNLAPGADLSGADLNSAHLFAADLSGADIFIESIFGGLLGVSIMATS